MILCLPNHNKEHGGNISENGFHEAIKVGDMIFDNLNLNGIKYDDWLDDLDINDLIREGHYKMTTKTW